MLAQGVRMQWGDVPAHVRARVEDDLGAPVTSATSQPGGFSPGVAARCRLSDGRRVFIKAVSGDQNPESPGMHRREARVAGALPAGLPTPRLLGVHDDDGWVVLIFEDVEGRPPPLPWTTATLGSAFDAFDRLAEATTPCPVPGLEPAAHVFAGLFDGFARLAGGDGAESLDPWARRHVERLARLEATWAAAAAGDALLHGDLRADNLLVRPDGTVVVVDWPSASVGAAWVDKALMLPSVGLAGPTPAQVERELRPFRGVPGEAVDAVVAAGAGYFLHRGALPDPPGLPTLRAFQRAQGEVALAWLRQRLRLE